VKINYLKIISYKYVKKVTDYRFGLRGSLYHFDHFYVDVKNQDGILFFVDFI